MGALMELLRVSDELAPLHRASEPDRPWFDAGVEFARKCSVKRDLYSLPVSGGSSLYPKVTLPFPGDDVASFARTVKRWSWWSPIAPAGTQTASSDPARFDRRWCCRSPEEF
jgi:hypothetical protein